MAAFNYIAQVRSSALHPFLPFLHEIGTPTEKFLTASKIPRKALEEPNCLIPLAAGVTFLNHVSKTEALPTLGLLVGQRTRFEQLGFFGELVRSSLTLYEALDTAQRMIGGFVSGCRLWLEQRGDVAWFCHQVNQGFNGGSYQNTQFSLMLMLNLIQQASGPASKAIAIHLQMPYNKEVASFEVFKDIPLLFGQRFSAIILPIKLFSSPLHPYKQELWLPLKEGANVFQQTAPAVDLIGSLRQVLKVKLREGQTGIQHIAESAGTSVRTLQRRLNEENIQYLRLLEEARFHLALEFLSQPKVKIKTVALELGYQDCANFSRAFRRWTGMAPKRYLQQSLGSE